MTTLLQVSRFLLSQEGVERLEVRHPCKKVECGRYECLLHVVMRDEARSCTVGLKKEDLLLPWEEFRDRILSPMVQVLQIAQRKKVAE